MNEELQARVRASLMEVNYEAMVGNLQSLCQQGWYSDRDMVRNVVWGARPMADQDLALEIFDTVLDLQDWRYDRRAGRWVNTTQWPNYQFR